MSVFVKVCGLTHADDVDAALDAGADALGFVFAASPRRVTPERAARIGANVPANVLRVAVMLHPSPADWEAVRGEFGPDVLQTDAADFAALEHVDGVTRWPVYREGGDAPAPGHGNAFVYEGPKSGSGRPVDWRQAATLAAGRRLILAGGLGPDNVADAIAAVRPFGVDASSSLEASPGRKDAAKINAYVRAAKAAQGELKE